MLKLPKGLKKKKKGKKSKRKAEEDLFTEEELQKYRREHQYSDTGEGSIRENEEWSKFKDLTTGVDSVLKKTQGDLDRIKSTSFFQRIPAGPKEVGRSSPKVITHRAVIEVTEADFPQLVQAAAAAETEGAEKSDYGVTDDESEEEEQDDIFDTSYVDAVERGEVKLAYVPDSLDNFQDDDIFDTSHVDALIKGPEAKSSKGKKTLDIGVAVEVLTGRIDNVTVVTTKKPKRTIPGDLLLETTDNKFLPVIGVAASEPVEKSILDLDTDTPITLPKELSISLHTSLIQQSEGNHQVNSTVIDKPHVETISNEDEEIDEFTLLATESLEVSAEVTRLKENIIKLEPVVQESWSAFEADIKESVFAECIVEDQIDIVDQYVDQDDPFDTSFAEAIVPSTKVHEVKKEAVILEDDDDFDPRAEEVRFSLNNRRKSSVRIHLTDPSGIRESITSDDIGDKEESQTSRDLLGGSTTDLTQLNDSPLDPVDINNTEIDPFDTTIVDKIVAPGRVELKFLEQELIGTAPVPLHRVPSDPDFNPRADEPTKFERRASRPENLTVNKSVVFDVVTTHSDLTSDIKPKTVKPVTPYYMRELSISEETNEEAEAIDSIPETLTRTRSSEDLGPKINYLPKRRHSEYPQPNLIKPSLKTSDLLYSEQADIKAKVLTPSGPAETEVGTELKSDPFDTSFANVAPSKIELKLLAKEFSCEDPTITDLKSGYDILEPSDDIFQVKALIPEPSAAQRFTQEKFDPFDTSFTGDLIPGKTELKLLESEFIG